jgi:NADPH:quinone reductase-like Zn-dependent oxidoreductase
VPDRVDVVSAAALPLAGLTALRLLRASGAVAGLRVLLTGASGGAGHYVTELASAAGASVTAVSASPERAERLLALGAGEVVQSLDEATGPYDVAFESVGGSSLAQALRLLTKGGRLIRHFDHDDLDVPVSRDLAILVHPVASDHLYPKIGFVAGWRQTASALQDLRERRVRGNAVLRIDHDSTSPTTRPGDGND